MNTVELLQAERERIVSDAASALGRDTTPAYQASPPQQTIERLGALFDALVRGLRRNDPLLFTSYVRVVAPRQFRAGVGLAEVLGAFDALELAVWARLLAKLAAGQFLPQSVEVRRMLTDGKRCLVGCYVAHVDAARPRHQGLWCGLLDG